VSELGDASSDALLKAGTAHDLIMRPVSRAAMEGLVERLTAGTPLGRAATRSRSNTAAALPRFPGLKVLVADDSAVNREVIIEALSSLQIEPDVVGDGRAAVDAAAKIAYDIVLMDCSMPVMDGFAATRAIRAAEAPSRRVPVIALTAHVAGATPGMWRDAGMDDYVTKPFTLRILAECFARWTGPAAERAAAAPSQPAPRGPAAQTDDRPVIDPGVLAMLAELEGDTGGDLVERVFGLFEAHAPTALRGLADLMRAAPGDNGDEIAAAAHALKSMCGTVGAVRVAQACAVLEEAARGAHGIGAGDGLARIEAELGLALRRIAELRRAA
jgi:CheY-like chemotaxis protein/HPt (histidine-containing phosphotransfer) domain-containing protein